MRDRIAILGLGHIGVDISNALSTTKDVVVIDSIGGLELDQYFIPTIDKKDRLALVESKKIKTPDLTVIKEQYPLQKKRKDKSGIKRYSSYWNKTI